MSQKHVCTEDNKSYKTESGIEKHNAQEHGGHDLSVTKTHVEGYDRKDGTHVESYDRNAPTNTNTKKN